ncbi:LysR family transcriptional regulator [Virgibacillus sp. W0181]|uniref:LysR family transcriptional regulator n=1 Tax=Virgibacillus sp. W0181 TaxID=3391581 RepID=UPI003F44D05D
MKIDDYELLIKLNEIGTVRGTAKAVLISQPAVSQRLKYIEDYFGEAIFIRTPKRLVVTPSGEIILHHAKKVVQQERKLKDNLAQSSEEVRGTLSIACSSLISQRFLPNILAHYTKEYPLVSIDLVTGLSENIKKDHKNYHVCIIRGEKLEESTSIHLFEDPLYIFDIEPFIKGEVKERPLISFKTNDSLNELADHWFYDQQGKKSPLKTIRVDQIETCKQFMKQGIGMAVLPKSVSDSLMDHYAHIPLQVNNKSVVRNTWLSYQEGIRDLPQVDRFINLLLNKTFI